MIIDIILGLLLALSTFTDIKSHKIYNWATFPGIILGLVFNASLYSWPGLKESLFGLLAGFGIFLLFYLAGWIGGGDVKLVAAIGALRGPSFSIWVAIYGAIIGGIKALFVMVCRKTLGKSLKYIFFSLTSLFVHRVRPVPLERKEEELLPYALFIALGVICRWLELFYKT